MNLKFKIFAENYNNIILQIISKKMQVTNHVELEFLLFPGQSSKAVSQALRKKIACGSMKIGESVAEQPAEKQEAEEEAGQHREPEQAEELITQRAQADVDTGLENEDAARDPRRAAEGGPFGFQVSGSAFQREPPGNADFFAESVVGITAPAGPQATKLVPNRFMRVAQISENQVLIQVRTPFICLAQKFKLLLRSEATPKERVDDAKDSNTNEQASFDRVKCQQSIKILKVQRLEVLSSNPGEMQWHDLLRAGDSNDQEESQDSEAELKVDGPGGKTSAERKAKEQKAQNTKRSDQHEGVDPKNLQQECYGISDTFRIIIVFDLQAMLCKQQQSQQQISGSSSSPCPSLHIGSNYQQIFQEIVEGISIHTHPCFKIPNASSLMPLLNLSNLFQLKNRLNEHLEIEILAAQSLMAARKFIQAIEKMRKIQADLLKVVKQARSQQNQINFRFDVQSLAIQLEILSADCMNQHSLQAEKMESYQRILDLSQDFGSVQPILQNNGFPRCQKQIRDSQIVEKLVKMNPRLVLVMKGCLYTNIESVKTACLKHIEYILDNIGCSIGNSQMPNIIQTLIQTYPRTNACNFVRKSAPQELQFFPQDPVRQQSVCLESFTKPTRSSININLSAPSLQVFDEICSQGIGLLGQDQHYDFSGQFNFSQHGYLQALLKNVEQVSIYKLYKEDIRIKEGNQHHQNQILNIKNHYNHILESILTLINSTSSFLSKHIFERILQAWIFRGTYDTIRGIQNEQLSTDLRVYLIKFSDKIAHICQGDLVMNHKFLNDLIKTMIPTLIVTKEQIQLENSTTALGTAAAGAGGAQTFGFGMDLVGGVGFNSFCHTEEPFLGQSVFADDAGKEKRRTALLDQHNLLKNPNLIVNDSVKLACENLWTTLKERVILRYGLTSEQMKFIITWINTNLQQLSQIVEQRPPQSSVDQAQASPQVAGKNQLTNGQLQFLNQNIELINQIVQLQISQLSLIQPRLSDQEKKMRKLRRRKLRKQRKQAQMLMMMPTQINESPHEAELQNFGLYGEMEAANNYGQLLSQQVEANLLQYQEMMNISGAQNHYSSNMAHAAQPNSLYQASYPFSRDDYAQYQSMYAPTSILVDNNNIPDNVTDLDLQNQLVDSIQDEFEEINQNDIDSNSLRSAASNNSRCLKGGEPEQELFMSHLKLSDIFNRQKRLDRLDQGNEAPSKLQTHLLDHNSRLIKIGTTNVLQGGIFELIQPLIYWLEYSVHTRDKIGLFKKIWSTLKQIIQKCTAQTKIKINLIKIIFPHLQKVKDVCKESTPSLDMLNFLKFVLVDIKRKALHSNKVLRDFLLEFLMVFCDCIPHNLHDEIFQICQTIMELTKHYLQRQHIEKLISSLVDKYTMRSKAYKAIMRYFLQTSLQLSQQKFEKMTSERRIYKFVLTHLREQDLLAHPQCRTGLNPGASGVQPHATNLNAHLAETSTVRQQSRQNQIARPDEPQREQTERGAPPRRGAAAGEARPRPGPARVHDSSISITHSQIVNNNAGIADLMSTSQDDLDNYVYEDQESGTHVLDDDLDGNDITNLTRYNQINNEYLQNQQMRQRHFRERTQHMEQQHHLQRQERREERERQDREVHRHLAQAQRGQNPSQAAHLPEGQGPVVEPGLGGPSTAEVPQPRGSNQGQRTSQGDQNELFQQNEAPAADQRRPKQRQPADEAARQRQGRQLAAKEPALSEIEQEITANFLSVLHQFQTPFDILCDICLFDNLSPTEMQSQEANLNNSITEVEIQLEIRNEKLDILMALFSELGSKHVRLFERFLIKLNDTQALKRLFEKNELSRKKIMMFALDIANYTNQNVKSVKINKYAVRPAAASGACELQREAQNHANQAAGASGGAELNPGYLRSYSHQDRQTETAGVHQAQANAENQNEREPNNAANPNAQVFATNGLVTNEVQNTGNTGHTGHSDFQFQVRRQSHNANPTNFDNSSLVQAQNNRMNANFRGNVNPQQQVNDQEQNQMSLNHSHNSLMFQNHLRGLGMQQNQLQPPAHLRSQHQSIQHNDFQPYFYPNLIESANAANLGGLPAGRQQVDQRIPNNQVEQVDGLQNRHFLQSMDGHQLRAARGLEEQGRVRGGTGAPLAGQQHRTHQENRMDHHVVGSGIENRYFPYSLENPNAANPHFEQLRLDQDQPNNFKTIADEVEILSASKLIVLKLFCQLINILLGTSLGSSAPARAPELQFGCENPQSQSQAMQLILYAFTYLLPTPTLTNQMFLSQLQSQRRAPVASPPGGPLPSEARQRSAHQLLPSDLAIWLVDSQEMQVTQQQPSAQAPTAEPSPLWSVDYAGMIRRILAQMHSARVLRVAEAADDTRDDVGDQTAQNRQSPTDSRAPAGDAPERRTSGLAEPPLPFGQTELRGLLQDAPSTQADLPERPFGGSYPEAESEPAPSVFVDFEFLEITERDRSQRNRGLQRDRGGQRGHDEVIGNHIRSKTECTNARYLNSVARFGLSLLPFVEKITLQSCGKHSPSGCPKGQGQISGASSTLATGSSFLGSAFQMQQRQPKLSSPEAESNAWVSQKYLCIQILTKVAQLYDKDSVNYGWKQRLHTTCVSLVAKLITTENSEDVACGLNLLAGLCGLTKQAKSLNFHCHGMPFQEERDHVLWEVQKLFSSPSTFRDHEFRVNGSRVSTTIWQDVFNIIEGDRSGLQNNEVIIREAASILIQIAAPRDSVSHFLKVAFEKSQTQVGKMLSAIESLNLDNQLSSGPANSPSPRRHHPVEEDSSEYYSEDSADASGSDVSSSSQDALSFLNQVQAGAFQAVGPSSLSQLQLQPLFAAQQPQQRSHMNSNRQLVPQGAAGNPGVALNFSSANRQAAHPENNCGRPIPGFSQSTNERLWQQHGLQQHVHLQDDRAFHSDPAEVMERNFQRYVQGYFFVDRYNDAQLLQMLKFFEDEYQQQGQVTSGAQRQLQQQFNTQTQSFHNYNPAYDASYGVGQSSASAASMNSNEFREREREKDREDVLHHHEHYQEHYYRNERTRTDSQPFVGLADIPGAGRGGQASGQGHEVGARFSTCPYNFKSLQNLWIDRGKQQAEGTAGLLFDHCERSIQNRLGGQQPLSSALQYTADFYQSHGGLRLLAGHQDAPSFDGFEDQIIQGLNSQSSRYALNHSRQGRPRTNSQENDESDYLIFERHFDKGRSTHQDDNDNLEVEYDSPANTYHYDSRQQRNDQSPTDDLGIIDLDNDDDEEDDLFDVDDDKLPVLKNIFSKKNRPNNGKSVAIGSRSQGGIMKIRPQGEPKIVSSKQRQGSGRNTAKEAQKNKSVLQKPNSAQRIRSKGSMQKHKNMPKGKGCGQNLKTKAQGSSVMSLQNRDESKPIVIYDEDNLICDDFFIGRQRPQSGRVSRQRPLSGIVTRLNPMHPQNKKASKQYNNKYVFQNVEQRQDLDQERIERNEKIDGHQDQSRVEPPGALRRNQNLVAAQLNQSMRNTQGSTNKMKIQSKNFIAQKQQFQRNSTSLGQSGSIFSTAQNRPTSSNNLHQSKRGSPSVLPQQRTSALTSSSLPPHTVGIGGQQVHGQPPTAASLSSTCPGPTGGAPPQQYGYPFAAEELKIQNSSLNQYPGDYPDFQDYGDYGPGGGIYSRQKPTAESFEHLDGLMEQFDSKIASSIEKINKKMQKQQLIKSLPGDGTAPRQVQGRPVGSAASMPQRTKSQNQVQGLVSYEPAGPHAAELGALAGSAPLHTEREVIRSPLPLTTRPPSQATLDEALNVSSRNNMDGFHDLPSPQDSQLRQKTTRDPGQATAEGAQQKNEGTSKNSRSPSKPSDEEDKALSASSIRVFIEDAKQARQDEQKKLDEGLESETTMQESKNDKKD